jgi:L-threonylcarbamoyladenylate synthase
MAFLSTSENDAIAALKAGHLVALPTETVYGLAADAENKMAVRSIFELKGRPSSNPLIVHISDISMAKSYAKWNNLADRLAQKYWPAPLTLVLPLRAPNVVAKEVLAGGDTIALRIPAHPKARDLIARFGRGIAAPSANRSGRISPTCAAHVLAEFPDADDLMVLDGGPCEVGLESTVVDCTGDAPVVLRAGSVLIDSALALTDSPSAALKSPGMLASHYAPNLPVRLNATCVNTDEALLAFGTPITGAAQTLNLSATENVEQAAQNLYAMLRALDDPKYKCIAVMLIPEHGIGLAINDRLKRAATR